MEMQDNIEQPHSVTLPSGSRVHAKDIIRYEIWPDEGGIKIEATSETIDVDVHCLRGIGHATPRGYADEIVGAWLGWMWVAL